MDASRRSLHVYGKTAAGIQALGATRGALPSSSRQLLILIDGKRTLGELQQMFPGETFATALETLEAQALIECLQHFPDDDTQAQGDPAAAGARATTGPAAAAAFDTYARDTPLPATEGAGPDTAGAPTTQVRDTGGRPERRKRPRAPLPIEMPADEVPQSDPSQGPTEATDDAAPGRGMLPIILGVVVVAAALGGILFASGGLGLLGSPRNEGVPASAAPAPGMQVSPEPATAPPATHEATTAIPATAAVGPAAAAAPSPAAASTGGAPATPAGESTAAARDGAAQPPSAAVATEIPASTAAAPVSGAAVTPVGAPARDTAEPAASPGTAPPASATQAASPNPAPAAPAAKAPSAGKPAPAAARPAPRSASQPLKVGPANPDAAPAAARAPTLHVRTQVMPQLPKLALDLGIASGHVVVVLHVNPEGSVERVELVSASPPQVYDAAMEHAFQQWTFDPLGIPGRMTVEIEVRPPRGK